MVFLNTKQSEMQEKFNLFFSVSAIEMSWLNINETEKETSHLIKLFGKCYWQDKYSA